MSDKWPYVRGQVNSEVWGHELRASETIEEDDVRNRGTRWCETRWDETEKEGEEDGQTRLAIEEQGRGSRDLLGSGLKVAAGSQLGPNQQFKQLWPNQPSAHLEPNQPFDHLGPGVVEASPGPSCQVSHVSTTVSLSQYS